LIKDILFSIGPIRLNGEHLVSAVDPDGEYRKTAYV
jgi:hypothetical protein